MLLGEFYIFLREEDGCWWLKFRQHRLTKVIFKIERLISSNYGKISGKLKPSRSAAIFQHMVNRLFQQDQKRVYQELNGEMTTEGTVPDADESKQFWSEIWGKDVEHEQNAECIWLKGQRQCKKILL